MVAVRKNLEIGLGRSSTKIPLLTELRTRAWWRLQKHLDWKSCRRRPEDECL